MQARVDPLTSILAVLVRSCQNLTTSSLQCIGKLLRQATVKGMVVESEVLKAQSCALSKLSLPVHSNVGNHGTHGKILIKILLR